jgi:bacillithiol system protein YtxJ
MGAPARIETESGIEAALTGERFLLFKHSTACPISVAAFSQYEEFAAANPDLPTSWIEVREQRPLSRLVAERTGVTHQSPQAIYLEAGRVIWHASHGGITVESLEDHV